MYFCKFTQSFHKYLMRVYCIPGSDTGTGDVTVKKKKEAKIPFFVECIVKIGRRKGQNINTDNLLDSNISYKKNQAVRERRQDEKRKCIFFFIILKGSSLQKCLSFFVLFCFFRTFKLFQLKKKNKTSSSISPIPWLWQLPNCSQYLWSGIFGSFFRFHI